MQGRAANHRADLTRSTPRSRFSTFTVSTSGYLVPWLAAQGPLAYSPTEPPARDYFFQYSWILPGIFDPKVNLREHRYFGCYGKSDTKFLFDFWDNARKGRGAGEMAAQAGLDIESPGFARDLWHAAQQSYSLDPVIGVGKFGPHHVVLQTSLSNIRLTTFFAGESEAKIIDPSRVSRVEAVGCKVEVIPPLQ